MAMLHPFDPAINRPRPNADGSVSTEVTRTIQFPDGSWANVPSLWWGEGDAVRDFGEMGDDQIGGLASQYEQSSGKQFPRFSDLPSAEAAAKSRSNAGGGGQGVITGGKPVTLERLAEGIRRANANGDIETVKKLGMAYRQMQGQGGGVTKLTGSVTPQGSSGDVSQNVGFAEGQAPTAQSEYDRRLAGIRANYYPNVDDAKWAEISQRDFKPYDSGGLLNAGLTFGLNDEASGASAALAAALSGQDAGKAFNDFTRMEQDRKTLGAEKQGALGAVSEVAGAILAGRPDQAAVRAVGTIPAIIQGGREAAIQGGLYGFASTDGDLQDRAVGALQGAGTGAAVGAAVPAVAAGFKGLFSRVGAVMPEIDDLYKARDAAYKAVDNSGFRYTPQQYDDLVNDIYRRVGAGNIDPNPDGAHKMAINMLNRLNNRSAPMTLGQLDDLRKVIRRDVIDSGSKADGHFGEIMLDAIDDFIDQAGGSQVIGAARSAHKTLRKSELLADAVEKARLNAASSGSGGNIDNALRQQIKQILTNPSKARSFTTAEKDIMRKIVEGGGKVQGFLRLVGKLSPSGNGLMAALGIGATAANPLMAVPIATGIGAKSLADNATKQGVRALERSVRTGGASAARNPIGAYSSALGAAAGRGVQPLLPPVSGGRSAVIDALLSAQPFLPPRSQ